MCETHILETKNVGLYTWRGGGRGSENVDIFGCPLRYIYNNHFDFSRGQMISQEDYNFITRLDNSTAEGRQQLLTDKPYQCAKTFLNLMGHISKDQTVQYILTMIDDMLQVRIFNILTLLYQWDVELIYNSEWSSVLSI